MDLSLANASAAKSYKSNALHLTPLAVSPFFPQLGENAELATAGDRLDGA